MIKVLDDFLTKEDFQPIQNFFQNSNLDWHYNSIIAGEGEGIDGFQFTHTFFTIKQPYLDIPHSSYCSILKPIFLKLAPMYTLRVKANLRTRTSLPIKSKFHTDLGIDSLTAIYYINSNNGYTLFKDGNAINSVENRMLIFDGDLYHSGVSCTDQKRRIVLNINYIPGFNQDGSEYIPD